MSLCLHPQRHPTTPAYVISFDLTKALLGKSKWHTHNVNRALSSHFKACMFSGEKCDGAHVQTQLPSRLRLQRQLQQLHPRGSRPSWAHSDETLLPNKQNFLRVWALDIKNHKSVLKDTQRETEQTEMISGNAQSHSGSSQLSGGTPPHLLGRGQGCSYIGGVSCHKGLAHSKQQSCEG